MKTVFAWTLAVALGMAFFLAAPPAGETGAVDGPPSIPNAVSGDEVSFKEGEPMPLAPPGMHWKLLQKPAVLPTASTPALPVSKDRPMVSSRRGPHPGSIMVWRLYVDQEEKSASEGACE